MSWRRYTAFLFLPAAISMGLAVASYAETKIATGSALEAKIEPNLVSVEGERKSARPAQAVKKAKKVELPSMSKEDQKTQGKMMTIKGMVTGVNNYGLAVEYGDDPKLGAREMWAELMTETKMSGFNKIRDIQMGDTVQLTYKDIGNGNKKLLKEIKFLKRKPAEPVVAEAPEIPERPGMSLEKKESDG